MKTGRIGWHLSPSGQTIPARSGRDISIGRR